MYIEAVLKGYKLLDVPQNPELRESLRNKTLEELETILASYKILHNKTDVDTAQRAIRAIEIEEYYKTQAPDVNEYNPDACGPGWTKEWWMRFVRSWLRVLNRRT